MNYVSFIRALKFAVQHSVRNIWLAVVTVFILFLTLLSITMSIGMKLMADEAVASVKERVAVNVYLKPDVLEEQARDLASTIAALPEVQEVRSISREDALAAFRAETSTNPVIQETLDLLGENPLGGTIVIHAVDIDAYGEILKVLDRPEYADLVQDRDFEESQAVITKLGDVTDKLRTVGLIVSGMFIVIAFLVIHTTLRIAIYSYREEIGIMKLVGASNWFVRAPYIIETLLYAIVASLATILVMSLFVGVIAPYVNNFFAGYDFNLVEFFQSHMFAFFAIPLIAGMVIAGFSGTVAVSRYLKV